MLLLDIFLVVLIVVCVFYSLILSRRISDLQGSRVEFVKMLKELDQAIVKAENNINKMSQLSNLASIEIKDMVHEAKKQSHDLLEINKVASNLAEKLSDHLNSLRNYEDNYDKIADSSNHGQNLTERKKHSKANEIFDDRGFNNIDQKPTYTNQLKNFIQNIITKKSNDGLNLDQMGYYDTLKKISIKK